MKVEAVPVSVDADTVRSVEMLRHVREMVSLYDDNGVVLQRNPAAALALPPAAARTASAWPNTGISKPPVSSDATSQRWSVFGGVMRSVSAAAVPT